MRSTLHNHMVGRKILMASIPRSCVDYVWHTYVDDECCVLDLLGNRVALGESRSSHHVVCRKALIFSTPCSCPVYVWHR